MKTDRLVFIILKIVGNSVNIILVTRFLKKTFFNVTYFILEYFIFIYVRCGHSVFIPQLTFTNRVDQIRVVSIV